MSVNVKQFQPKALNERAFDYYSRLSRIKQYVEANYSEQISLDVAARIAAMETTYFSTFFHSKVGITFREWLRQVRVAKAIDLMTSKDYSVSEIAYAVGFGDLRTFERAFKRVVGTTPFEYKKTVRPC